MIIPNPLNTGDAVGLVAPARQVKKDEVDLLTDYLKSKELNVKWGAHIFEHDRFVAGSNQFRAADIMTFFSDPNIKGIFTIHGGYGSMRFLDLLDYDVIKKNPKAFVGFSDTTSLQLALNQKADLVSYSGFTVRDLLNGLQPLTEKTLWQNLYHEPVTVTDFDVVNKGDIRAPLMGGMSYSYLNLDGNILYAFF